MIYIIITIAIAIILALLAFTRQLNLKARAKECAKEAKRFHERLQQLTDPSHDFTDNELHRLKKEFAPLLDEVNGLYDSILISNEYLDDLGLGDFLEERKLVNHQQYLNNSQHIKKT